MASGTDHPENDMTKATENYSRFLGIAKMTMAIVAVVVIVVVLLIS